MTSESTAVSGFINPRRACTARVTVLALCVCVSVTQHLTFHEIIRATNDTTFSAADEGRNFKRFSLKMLRYEARAFPVGTAT